MEKQPSKSEYFRDAKYVPDRFKGPSSANVEKHWGRVWKIPTWLTSDRSLGVVCCRDCDSTAVVWKDFNCSCLCMHAEDVRCMEWSVKYAVPEFAFTTKETTENLVRTVGPEIAPWTFRMQS